MWPSAVDDCSPCTLRWWARVAHRSKLAGFLVVRGQLATGCRVKNVARLFFYSHNPYSSVYFPFL